MPIYEYRCEQGHTFEVMQRITDDPVATCQTCDAPVSRVFHPVAVHFKGSGFYTTDYGSRKRSQEQKESADGAGKDTDSAAKSDSAKSDSAKSDSKSTKTESTTSSSSKSD